MRETLLKKSYWICLLVWVLGACSNMRYLEEGEQLYTGSNVKIVSEDRIPDKGAIISELEEVIRPQPNGRFLFWRPRLWFYNIAGDDPSTGIGNWIKNTLGRPPVLWEDFNVERSKNLMENRLFNMGFFDPYIEHEVKEKEKRVSLDFTINLKPAFTIREIIPLQTDDTIAREINESMEETRLAIGQNYNLTELRSERERIAEHLRDLGYYFFHPDFLLFRVDTTGTNRDLALMLTLKPNIPTNAIQKHIISDVYVNTNHSLDISSARIPSDTIYLDSGIYLVNNQQLFRPKAIRRVVFFEKEKMYNMEDHDLTLNHLMGLGTFKFVNIRFNETTLQDHPALDVNILLTPMEKKTLSAEVRGVSKSTGFAGPGMSLSFSNRNFLSGAEHFIFSIDGAFETLIGQGERRASSLEAGASAELIIPRFIAPFGISDVSPRFIPKTRILTAFSFLNRTDAFSVSSIRSQFGYEWRQSETSSYRLVPFVFNIFSLGNITPEYQRFFSQEVLLRRGLFEQFILGSEFSYYWNTLLRREQKHDWYFNYNLDLSGNLAYFMLDRLNLASPGEDGMYGIFNQGFSQYTKNDIDVRYYLDLGHGQRLATRLIAGIGFAYGNSTTLPYVKLFTIGGSNSIRAFHPRGLGPGSYNSPDTLARRFDIYQSGDIKLEFNLEYRFRFNNIVKGAVFTDAGNIWNRKEIDGAPGGKFDSSTFLEQVALGTGFGLRFDFTFFLLRLDLAFPLAVPYDDHPSYFQPFRPLSGTWRRDNLLLNLAIGYPF
jgi:outer membrane protein insertion porin family